MNKIKIGFVRLTAATCKGIAGLSDEERVRHVVDDGDQTADDAGDRHFGDGPRMGMDFINSLLFMMFNLVRCIPGSAAFFCYSYKFLQFFF